MKLKVEIKVVNSETEEETHRQYEGEKAEIEDIIETEFSDFLSDHNPDNHPIQPNVTEWADLEVRSFTIEETKTRITFTITK